MKNHFSFLLLLSVYLFDISSHTIQCLTFQGYYSQGKGKTEVNDYDSFSRSICEPTVVPFEELNLFGSPKAVFYECPNGHEISGIEYTTDSLRLYITGIKFICSDNESFVLLGSEKFAAERIAGKYLKGGINEVAFGYDPEKPIIKLLQIVKEAPLPKGSKFLLSFVPSGDQLLRSKTFLGEKPTKLCAVIIQNSEFVAPVIGNLIIRFSMERPLVKVPYSGFIYTGVPSVHLGIPDSSKCSPVSGVGTSSSNDVNFRIRCPEGKRIIGINMNLGDRINSSTLKNISNEILKSSGILFEKKSDDNDGFDPLIDNFGHESEFHSWTIEDQTVNNAEILMLRFLCSDYITSFSIGQPLSNATSWNILDKIPQVEKWDSSPELIGNEVLNLIKKTAEESLVLGTADVRLGNINSVLLGYSTGKLKIEAIVESKGANSLGHTVSDYVERYTFGPIFIDVAEYVNFDFKTRNVLKLLPEVYPSSAIDARKGYSGDAFWGVCGRIMYGSFLLGSFGFETSKIVKPFYRQIFTTPGVRVEKNSKNGVFNCEMFFPSVIQKEAFNYSDEIIKGKESVRSSLRSFQGSLRCPPGTSIESIQVLDSTKFGIIDGMRFNCGGGFETYFVLGTPIGTNLLSGSSFPTNKERNYRILTSQISEVEQIKGETLYDLIGSIYVSRSKHFASNSVRIPEFNLPISAFGVIQKTKNETISYISERYPPDFEKKKTWENGVLTEVCADVRTDGIVGNIGFKFEHPFRPTARVNISESHGFSMEGNGILDADTKGFECDGMLHSPRSQLLFNKHINDIIFSGKLKSKSKKTLIRAINFKCPGSSIIDRVEATWAISRGSNYVYSSRSEEKRSISGSIVALKFFCSDGKSSFKVGSDSRVTHSQKNISANEVFMGYRALTNEEISRVKKNLLQDNTINVTEELLKLLPGDPASFKIVHESFPISTLQFDVSGSKQYKSAEEALDSLRLRETQSLRSKIWKGGNWKGVCVGLLNLNGGLVVKNEFSITSFGAYFEKPSPLVKMPYKGYIQTGIPQVHMNKVVSTCNMTTPPKYGYEYPGFSATFMCPNGTHIERIGYSTVNSDNSQYEMLKNGTLSMPPPFREQKHLGPLDQIRSIQLICSDGVSTITIGEPSKAVAYSAPGDIGTIKIGYIRSDSKLVGRNANRSTFLVPASIEILSKNSKEKLLKFSNPNFPEYTQETSIWSGENLKAVCVDFAISENVRNKEKDKQRRYLSWAGNVIRIPEKYHIMSIGFAFQRNFTKRRAGKQESVRTVKSVKKIHKIKTKSSLLG